MAKQTAPKRAPVNEASFAALAAGTHGAPHDVLGPHPHGGAVTIRTLQPLAEVGHPPGRRHRRRRWSMSTAACGSPSSTKPDVPDYRVVATYEDGHPARPRRPVPVPAHARRHRHHLIGEGRHEQIWDVLGSHVHHYDDLGTSVTGTSFGVWAPNARGVRIAGDFNGWNSTAHPMRLLGASGVWELFIPNIGDGTMYHYDVCGADGVWRRKSDPLATHTEVHRRGRSVVFTSRYPWHDAEWMTRRAQTQLSTSPMSIYEVHVGSWRAAARS